MRIDKVRHREVNIRHFQPHINNLAKKGLTSKEIENTLRNFKIQIHQREETEIIQTPTIAVKPSNLGKGFIALFYCPRCFRKTKTLYLLNDTLACRLCHGLTYKKQDRREIEINRLTWDDELRSRYFASGRWAYIKKAMEAEFAKEEIVDRGYETARSFNN